MAQPGARESFTVIRGWAPPVARGAAPVPIIPARPGYEHLTVAERSGQHAVATRRALLHRVALLAAIAPRAPLSFLLVHVELRERSDAADTGLAPVILPDVAGALSRLVRATDLAGHWENATFGVVLQGRAARSAAVLSARAGHHLNMLPVVANAARVRVAVATGTGADGNSVIERAANALRSQLRSPAG